MVHQEVGNVDRNADTPNLPHPADKHNYLHHKNPNMGDIPHHESTSTMHQITSIRLDKSNITSRTLLLSSYF